MKKCYYFPTWEEEKNVLLSLDESCILVYPTNTVDPEEDFNLSHKLNQMVAFNDSDTWIDFELSTSCDPILAKLCKLTGAKMFGEEKFGYYIIIKDNSADIIDITENKTYNVFQEYSKFLRNEENKFKEVKKIYYIIMIDI
jgi:hypothetical protein